MRPGRKACKHYTCTCTCLFVLTLSRKSPRLHVGAAAGVSIDACSHACFRVYVSSVIKLDNVREGELREGERERERERERKRGGGGEFYVHVAGLEECIVFMYIHEHTLCILVHLHCMQYVRSVLLEFSVQVQVN